MSREIKKKPSDYPQLAFRVTQDYKDEVQKAVDKLHKRMNKAVSEDEKRVKKNEILMEALKLGLESLTKR